MKTFLLFLLLIIPVAVLLGVVYALITAARIKRNPVAVPYEQLSLEPAGKEVYVSGRDGTQIRCKVAGEGPVVVMAHGYGVSLIEWNLIAPQLVDAGYQVIMFDQRGHEKSSIGPDGIGPGQMAGDYRSVLEYFEVKGGILVAHSMGGFLAIRFLLDHPEVAAARLKGFVIMASFAGDVSRKNAQNQLQIPMIKNGLLKKLVQNETIGYLFGNSMMGNQPDPVAIKLFLEVLLRQDHMSLIPILEALVKENYYGRLAEIQIPTIVLVGTEDKTTPSFHSEDLAEGIAGAGLRKIAGVGHMINWEAPEEIVIAIKELMEEKEKA
jgi:non-heme chloroperoxidase